MTKPIITPSMAAYERDQKERDWAELKRMVEDHGVDTVSQMLAEVDDELKIEAGKFDDAKLDSPTRGQAADLNRGRG